MRTIDEMSEKAAEALSRAKPANEASMAEIAEDVALAESVSTLYAGELRVRSMTQLRRSVAEEAGFERCHPVEAVRLLRGNRGHVDDERPRNRFKGTVDAYSSVSWWSFWVAVLLLCPTFGILAHYLHDASVKSPMESGVSLVIGILCWVVPTTVITLVASTTNAFSTKFVVGRLSSLGTILPRSVMLRMAELQRLGAFHDFVVVARESDFHNPMPPPPPGLVILGSVSSLLHATDDDFYFVAKW